MTSIVMAIGQWLILAALVLVAVSAAGALGWLLTHKPEEANDGSDKAGKDRAGASDDAAAQGKAGTKGTTGRSKRRERRSNKPNKRSARVALADDAEADDAQSDGAEVDDAFEAVTDPTASSDEVDVPDSLEWEPPDLPEEYAATVINVAPINAGVFEAHSAPTPVRPEDMDPAVWVPRDEMAGSPGSSPSASFDDQPTAIHAAIPSSPTSPVADPGGFAISSPVTVSPPEPVAPVGVSARTAPSTHHLANLSNEELREQLALAHVEMGQIEAGAVAAWDRVVPALEAQIADLQSANAQLEAQLRDLQQALGQQPGSTGRRKSDRRAPQLSSMTDRRA